jgi:hypothetical protein
MPLFLLSYREVDQTVIGFAVVEALDQILARRAAQASNIHCPGALCTVVEIDPASVAPILIGRRLPLEDFVIKRRLSNV